MARKAKKYHFIYKTTNLLSGRYYIGMHSTNDLADGYMGSGKRLKRSLNKYGKENHKVEILEFFDSREELKKREKEIVSLNEIAKEECMNLVVGGQGGFTPEQQRLNAEKSNAKQSLLRVTDLEWANKKKEAISNGLSKSYEEGRRERKYFFDWTGKQHDEETKNKIGVANSEKQKGRGNSQYGTCWITKEGINKKIKKEELELFSKQGWSKGRKLV